MCTHRHLGQLADIVDRIGEVENRLCFLEDEHERQKVNLAASAAEVETLRQKLDDIENREQRNYLRFVGFPEDCEDNGAVLFQERVLPKILNIEFPKGLEVERAHRVGVMPRDEGDWPRRARPLTARFLCFQKTQKEQILLCKKNLKQKL